MIRFDPRCYCTFSYFSALILDLKNRLVSFIERETLVDYDREAEAALQRLTNGEVDINKLTNSWAKAYSEVRARSQFKWFSYFVSLHSS